MTRTEERLTEYLNAVADSVRADSTRPLAPPAAPAPERVHRLHRLAAGQRGWRGWVVPLAAAALVVAVAVSGAELAANVGDHHAAGASVHPAAPGAAAPLPRYYMEAEGLSAPSPVVRSVATGAVIGRVPNPGGGHEAAMAAAPDDRTFYVVYGPRNPSARENKYTIYSVTVLNSGKVTAPVPVKGGAVTYTNSAATALAVSPDGGRLAMTLAISTPSPGFPGQRVADEILVIDLRTGARQVWQGGLDQAGYELTVGSVAWAGDGQSVEFLATWCADGTECVGGIAPSRPSSQVRSLPLSTGGGSLDASAVLLREPYFVASMAAAPAGDIDLLTLSGQESGNYFARSLTVSQFSADGRLERVLYRRTYPESSILRMAASSLSTDPSGSHLLLGQMLYRCKTGFECGSDASTIGWIAEGTFHPLASYANLTSETAW